MSPSNQVMAVGYSGYPEGMELEEIEQEETHKEYSINKQYIHYTFLYNSCPC